MKHLCKQKNTAHSSTLPSTTRNCNTTNLGPTHGADISIHLFTEELKQGKVPLQNCATHFQKYKKGIKRNSGEMKTSMVCVLMHLGFIIFQTEDKTFDFKNTKLELWSLLIMFVH